MNRKVGFLSGTSSPFGQRFRVGPMPMNYLGSILEYAALGGERSNFLDGVPTSFTGSTLASVPNSSSRLQLDYAEFAHSQLSDSRYVLSLFILSRILVYSTGRNADIHLPGFLIVYSLFVYIFVRFPSIYLSYPSSIVLVIF